MPDDQTILMRDEFRLDPPVAVPDPAPLDMPRRQLRLLPFELSRLVPRPALLRRFPENAG